MTSSSQSSERIRTDALVPRVVILDRDAKRLLATSKALGERGFVSSGHLSTDGFWLAVPKTRPTVLVLEVVPPLLSAVRTVALATEMLGRAPGVVLYGWAPEPALRKLAEQIPGTLVLARDEGPRALCDAILAAHELAEPRVSGVPAEPIATVPVATVPLKAR